MVGFFRYPKRKLRKLVHDGDYPEAIAFGKSIESKYAKDHDFLFIMGSVYYILDDAQNALKYFDRVLEINGNDTEALYLSANVYHHLKDIPVAKANCKKILEIDPNHKGANELMKTLEG